MNKIIRSYKGKIPDSILNSVEENLPSKISESKVKKIMDEVLNEYTNSKIEPGEGIPDEAIKIRIPCHQIAELQVFLQEKGFTPKLYAPVSRDEDLKIVHRLLDIIEKEQDNEIR